MENLIQKTCSNCGSMKFKSWEQLKDDEKFVVKRIQGDNKFSNQQRKKQRFCGRCFYMIESDSIIT